MSRIVTHEGSRPVLQLDMRHSLKLFFGPPKALAPVLSASVLCTAALTAQQFEAVRGDGLPPESALSGIVSEFFDANGDGFVDVVVSSGRSEPVLLLNDRSGLFVDGTAGRLASAPAAATISAFLPLDFDLDGDVDLYESRTSTTATLVEQDRLFENLGGGVFVDVTATRLPVEPVDIEDPVVADVTGDGFPDVVGRARVFLGPESVALLVNSGGAGFADASATLPSVPEVDSVAVIDADTDGDLDLAVAGSGHRLFVNDGLGNFSSGPTIGPPAVVRDHLPTDVDGDGDTDLFVSVFFGTPIRLVINDGTGVFVDESAVRLPPEALFANQVADYDSDGDVDVLVSTADGQFWAVNDGSGVFSLATERMPFLTASVGDVDNDGDRDLLGGDFNGRPRLLLNRGGASFIDLSIPATAVPDPGSFVGRATAVADFDLNGSEDFLALGFNGEPPTGPLHLNDGFGTFEGRLIPALSSSNGSAVATADVDGDGDPDLIVSRSSTGLQLLENDGAAGFTDVTTGRLPPGGSSPTALRFADVDGDGDHDLVQANFGLARLFLNDGSGSFSEAPAAALPSTGFRSRGVRVADVDRDGDVDLVFANDEAEAIRIFENDGTGVFVDVTASAIPATAFGASDVAVGDVDGDGWPDLIASSFGDSPQLLLSNANGTFRVAMPGQIPPSTNLDSWIESADFDEDGDLDFVIGEANVNGMVARYLVNDGTGSFTVGQEFENNGRAVVLDFDADGDQDLVIREAALANRRRHLHFSKPARVGRATELSLSAVGRPNGAVVGVCFFSAAAGRTPSPFGVIGLDLATLIEGPAISLTNAEAFATVDVAIPPLSSLAGATVFSQALTLEIRAGRLLLTNASRKLMFQ